MIATPSGTECSNPICSSGESCELQSVSSGAHRAESYLLHIPRLFRALGTSSFEARAAQRTNDGIGVAIWLPPGAHGDDGPLEAVIAETIAQERQAEVAAVFERTEDYRPTEPHWYLR